MDKKEKNVQLKDSIKYFKRFLFLVKPYWSKIIKGLALGVVIGLIGMVMPFLTKILIDKVYPTEDISLMHVLVAAIFGIGISSILIGTLQGYYSMVINTHLSNSTSLMFFNHLQHLKIRFYDEHRVGEIMSRFGDLNSSLKAVNTLFQTIFVNGIYLFIVPPFLFLLHWKLAIISLISIPATVIIIALTGKFVRRLYKKSAEAFAELSAFQIESLTNIRLIKTMVLERYVFNKTKDQIEKAINVQLKAGALGQSIGLLNGFVRIANTALFTWLGWHYILGKEMSLGDYMAFSAYIGYLYNPLSQIVNLFSDFQQTSVSLNRMYEYLDSDTEQNPEIVFEEAPKINNRLSGDIEIKGINFSYNDDKKVLQNIDLNINKGMKVAVIGPSGSGKTTLLRLLLGMESIKTGQINYSGKSIGSYSLFDLRKQISVVWQEFSIIKGTIWDNLVLGLEEVDEQLVNKVIEICKLDEHIKSLPNGYHTEISEAGSNLSGGQRQRISIARALLRNAPILILDEATSNIDLATEAELLKNIFEFLKDKTIIFVTHRMTCTHLADMICLLENGSINSTGTHEELLNKSDVYRQMFYSSSNTLKEMSFKNIKK
ncbi:MAG: peptidase domain-containing ABC transporter [Melioribacteraceae bacterium]